MRTPQPVLVLEPGRKDPVGTMTWQRGVTLALFADEVRRAADRGEIIRRVDEDGHPLPYIEVLAWQGEDSEPVLIHSGGGASHLVPAVVCLSKATTKRRGVAKFCAENVYERDRGVCQYCQRHVPFRQATRDHVVPRAQGGTTCWENICLSCSDCNSRKANRTPEQAGMRLLKHPVAPPPFSVGFHALGRRVPEEWRKFLSQ